MEIETKPLNFLLLRSMPGQQRNPDLIRPLPVLMKTMDYLVELLALFNFLWDNMRSVRMDLRMQHIFNLESISMLEQMIRLHIIALHELWEYNKGEGFDAHLNIEQMNKALVELFQMYEDPRRKGISVPTEREFHGYYALFKMDKHPGYKVEPAELSLDLAKMSREVRCSPEAAFAKDVAKEPQEVNKQAAFIPERPIDVQAVPPLPLPLPSPPVCTCPVPVMQAANAHRVMMSMLSAPVRLPPSSMSAVHVTSSVNASSGEKVASIKEGEMEMILAEKKSREKMELFKERLKPIIRKWRKRAKEMKLVREKERKKTWFERPWNPLGSRKRGKRLCTRGHGIHLGWPTSSYLGI